MIRRRFPPQHNMYNRCVTFLYGTAAEINAVLKRDCPAGEEMLEVAPNALGFWRVYRQDGFEADYICIVKGKGRANELSSLAHECLHHTSHVMRNAGIALSRKSEEAYCYYLGWIYRNCLEAMR